VAVDGATGVQDALTANTGTDRLVVPQRAALTPAGDVVLSDFTLDDFEGGLVSVDLPGGAQSLLRQNRQLFNNPLGVAVVANRPPVASMSVSPAVAGPGRPVSFDASLSSDPERLPLRYEWDLDGDGSFETAGNSAGRAFPAGSFNVSVRVTDTQGAFAIATQTIVVSAPPPATQAPQISSQGPQLRLLNPFPIVRIAGRIGRSGTRFRVLSVNAPQGATVTVRCAGRGCPFKASSRSAKVARALRIKKLEQRLLRSGALIRIFVTKPGMIGKFTSIRVRRGKPPRRADRCLMPDNNTRPVKCPS
jgi:hypothetical protein